MRKKHISRFWIQALSRVSTGEGTEAQAQALFMHSMCRCQLRTRGPHPARSYRLVPVLLQTTPGSAVGGTQSSWGGVRLCRWKEAPLKARAKGQASGK